MSFEKVACKPQNVTNDIICLCIVHSHVSPKVSCSFTQHSMMASIQVNSYVSTAVCVLWEQWDEYFMNNGYDYQHHTCTKQCIR